MWFSPLNAVPKLTVPITRSLVYDVRERIYHNKEKVMTRSDTPSFTHSPFSREPSDRKLFPQTLVHSKDRLLNVEVVDPVLNVKLRHYYSRSQFSGKTVELHWLDLALLSYHISYGCRSCHCPTCIGMRWRELLQSVPSLIVYVTRVCQMHLIRWMRSASTNSLRAAIELVHHIPDGTQAIRAH